jgi:hypothetical protein
MKFPQEIIDRLITDTDIVKGLSGLIRATTGLVNWILITTVVTGIYHTVIEVGSWFR